MFSLDTCIICGSEMNKEEHIYQCYTCNDYPDVGDSIYLINTDYGEFHSLNIIKNIDKNSELELLLYSSGFLEIRKHNYRQRSPHSLSSDYINSDIIVNTKVDIDTLTPQKLLNILDTSEVYC